MAIQKFEDIIAWQKAQDFAVEMYAAFETSKDHSVVLRFPFQIIGFDRSSDADVARFLFISIASCSEVKSMHHLAEK